MRFRQINSLLLLCVPLAMLFISGCSTSPDDGPLVYNREYSGNISALFGPVGAERTSLDDGYAPQFYWRNSTGALDSLTGQRGKIVLLNFWATWCAYCVQEMPELQAIFQEMADSVVVIGVSIDDNGDVFSKVSNYCRSNNYTYQMVVDSNFTIYYHYFLSEGIPQSFVIDANGNIGPVISGEQSKASFIQAIEAAK
ncbi:MAG TPA: TlpA disulfide reductase family protein [Candidatus Kapabacteria bacterium]|jgi:peroxiredoxin|nr:TlpA disulfide reductase family protein [Candidatus Kapabacteria bacterium]